MTCTIILRTHWISMIIILKVLDVLVLSYCTLPLKAVTQYNTMLQGGAVCPFGDLRGFFVSKAAHDISTSHTEHTNEQQIGGVKLVIIIIY